MATFSDKPWSSFSAADYTDEQYHAACLIHLHDGGGKYTKADCKLPVKEPSGAYNKNGIHAAASVLAGGRGGVQAPPDQKRKAARSLIRLYGEMKETPPPSLKRVAGE